MISINLHTLVTNWNDSPPDWEVCGCSIVSCDFKFKPTSSSSSTSMGVSSVPPTKASDEEYWQNYYYNYTERPTQNLTFHDLIQWTRTTFSYSLTGEFCVHNITKTTPVLSASYYASLDAFWVEKLCKGKITGSSSQTLLLFCPYNSQWPPL